ERLGRECLRVRRCGDGEDRVQSDQPPLRVKEVHHARFAFDVRLPALMMDATRWEEQAQHEHAPGPRNEVPATHGASLRAFTPVFDVLWTRVNALLLSRGAPRGRRTDEDRQTERRDKWGSAMLERSRLGSVPARVWRDECRRAVG